MKAGYVNSLLQRAHRPAAMPRPPLAAAARAPRYEVSDVVDAPARAPAAAPAAALDHAATARAERARAWDTAMRIANAVSPATSRHADAAAPSSHASAPPVRREAMLGRSDPATSMPTPPPRAKRPPFASGDDRPHRIAPLPSDIDTSRDDRFDAPPEATPPLDTPGSFDTPTPVRALRPMPDAPHTPHTPPAPPDRAELPERLIVRLPADQPPLTRDVRASLDEQVRRAARQALREHAPAASRDDAPRHVEVHVGRVEVNVAAPVSPVAAAPARVANASAGEASMRTLARRLSGW